MEFLGAIVFDAIFAAFGWTCLMIWYRDRKIVSKIRDKEYAGLYSAAGRIFLLNSIAAAGAVAMFSMVLYLIGDALYKYFTR